MKRKLWLLALVGAMLLSVSPVLADDGFYVIAGGGQAVGTKITSLPYTINNPGFYYLTGNLSTTGTGSAISINVGNVTLDLMGFCLTGPSKASGTGIAIQPGANGVEVRNGSLSNFLSGVFGDWADPTASRRLANLRVSGCGTGIEERGDGSIITGCEVTGNATGIVCNSWGGIIEKNTASNNTNTGFNLEGFSGAVTNNAATGNGTGFKLSNQTYTLVDRNASVTNNTNWSGLTGCKTGLNTP